MIDHRLEQMIESDFGNLFDHIGETCSINDVPGIECIPLSRTHGRSTDDSGDMKVSSLTLYVKVTGTTDSAESGQRVVFRNRNYLIEDVQRDPFEKSMVLYLSDEAG